MNAEVPNRNPVSHPGLQLGRTPEDWLPGTVSTNEMTFNVVLCSLGSFLINRFLLRLAPDKWAVALGVMIPFVAGEEINAYLADSPKKIAATFHWIGYNSTQRFSINPRK